MRDNLRKHLHARLTVTGTVQRFGNREAADGSIIACVCFENVANERGQVVTYHVWFDLSWFEALDLRIGDDVTFTAVVERYRKGFGYDYGLSKPVDVRRIGASRE